MSTHIHKKFKEKSPPVTKGFSQEQTANVAHSQFADNRPEAMQFKQLQEAANNSEAVLQLKKLQSGVLNVVGEHHTESNNRRDQEKSIASQEVGGEYWTESEFRIRKRKLMEFYTKGSDQDPRAFGDPIMLRIAESLRYVEKANNDFEKNWIAWIRDDLREDELIEIKNALQSILVDCKTHLIAAYELLVQAGKNEERNAYTEMQEFQMMQMGKHIVKTKTYFLDVAEVWKAKDLGNLIATDYLKLFKKFSYKIDLLCISAGNLGATDLDTVSELRSDAMDKGAEKGKNQVGVWKIGYKHVGDIKRKMEEEETKNYQLIDREEFNDEYKELPILVDGKMTPQLGSSGTKVSDSITEDML